MSRLFLVGLLGLTMAYQVSTYLLADAWRVLVAVGGGIGFLLLTCFDPLKGLLAWVLLSPILRPYVEVPLPAGIPDLTFERLTIFCLCLVLLLQVALQTRRLVPIGTIEKVMAFFVGVGYISLLFRGMHIGRNALIFFDEYALPFLLFVVAKNLFHSQDEMRKLQSILLVLGLYVALHGIYQYATYSPTLSRSFAFEDLTTEGALGQDKHLLKGRSVGPFNIGHTYGFVLTVAFLWTLHLLLSAQQGAPRFILVSGLVLMGLGVFLSFTRTTWLGMYASLCVIVLGNQKWRKAFVLFMAVLTIAATFTWLILPQSSALKERILDVQTIYGRLVVYKTALLMSLAQPIFGYGKDMWGLSRHEFVSSVGSISALFGLDVGPPHNEFLHIFVQYGLLGLVPYLAIFCLMIRSGLSLMRLSPDKKSSQHQAVIFFWATLTAYVILGQFTDVGAFPFLSSLLYIFAGIIAGLHYRASLPNVTTAG